MDKAVVCFRQAAPRKYLALIKMHLSQCLPDISADLLNSISLSELSDSTSPTGIDSNGVFGAPLSFEGIAQTDQLLDFLWLKENIEEEGIFRKAGSPYRQAELASVISSGTSVDFSGNRFSVHDVASVYKQFLIKLPEPVMTEASFPIYKLMHSSVLDQQSMSRKERGIIRANQLMVIQLLLSILPYENLEVLKSLFKLLQRVAKFQLKNLMDAKNLGTIFAPLLLLPRNISSKQIQDCSQWMCRTIALMVSYADRLFKVPNSLMRDIRKYIGDNVEINSSILRKLSNDSVIFNSSIGFVDKAQSSMDGQVITTDTEMAALMATIQGMPESKQKKALIKRIKKINRGEIGIPGSADPSPFVANARLASSLRRKFKRRSRSAHTSSQLGVNDAITVTVTGENTENVDINGSRAGRPPPNATQDDLGLLMVPPSTANTPAVGRRSLGWPLPGTRGAVERSTFRGRLSFSSLKSSLSSIGSMLSLSSRESYRSSTESLNSDTATTSSEDVLSVIRNRFGDRSRECTPEILYSPDPTRMCLSDEPNGSDESVTPRASDSYVPGQLSGRNSPSVTPTPDVGTPLEGAEDQSDSPFRVDRTSLAPLISFGQWPDSPEPSTVVRPTQSAVLLERFSFKLQTEPDAVTPNHQDVDSSSVQEIMEGIHALGQDNEDNKENDNGALCLLTTGKEKENSFCEIWQSQPLTSPTQGAVLCRNVLRIPVLSVSGPSIRHNGDYLRESSTNTKPPAVFVDEENADAVMANGITLD